MLKGDNREFAISSIDYNARCKYIPGFNRTFRRASSKTTSARNKGQLSRLEEQPGTKRAVWQRSSSAK